MEYRNQWENMTNNRYMEGMQIPFRSDRREGNYSGEEIFFSSGSQGTRGGDWNQGMGIGYPNRNLNMRNSMMSQSYEYSEMEPQAPIMYDDDQLPLNRNQNFILNNDLFASSQERTNLGPNPPNMSDRMPSVANAEVRVLNGVNSNDVFHITIGNTIDIKRLAYGEISNYEKIPEGYQTIVVSKVEGTEETMQIVQSIPLAAGEKITLAIVNTADGLTVIQMDDANNNEISRGIGSLRIVNISYEDSAFDIVSDNGEVAFAGLRYMDSTPFKQSEIGDYDFFITETTANLKKQETSIINKSEVNSQENNIEHLIAFSLDIAKGSHYTAYIIGNSDDLRMIIS